MNTNKKIFRAALIIGALTVIAKLSAAARDLLTANYFGTQNQLDAYLLGLLVPFALIGIVGQSYATAFLPAYMEAAKNSPERRGKIISHGLAELLVIAVLLCALLALCAPALTKLLAPRYSVQDRAIVESFYLTLLWLFPLGALSSFFSTLLNADDHFAFTALAPFALYLLAALAIIFLNAELGVWALSVGMISGMTAQTFLLALKARRAGLLFWPRFTFSSFPSKHIHGQLIPLITGSLLMGSTTIVDQSMAALIDVGSVSKLAYGTKVVGFFLDIGAFALGTAIFPYFARMTAQGDWRGVRHTLKVYSRLIFISSIPVTAFLALASLPITRIVFERGSFSSTDSFAVAGIQSMLALQIPFYLAGTLYTRLLPALGASKHLVIVTIGNILLNVSLNWLLMRPLGVAGIGLSTSIVYFSAFLLLRFLALRSLPRDGAELPQQKAPQDRG